MISPERTRRTGYSTSTSKDKYTLKALSIVTETERIGLVLLSRSECDDGNWLSSPWTTKQVDLHAERLEIKNQRSTVLTVKRT